MDTQPFVLTTFPELGNEPVIVARNHIFYEPKKLDVFLNVATVEANMYRLQNVAQKLGWGEHAVFLVMS